ncbi:SLC13 family permease [Paenibacillus hexagrammi]|uniref:Anion permease n=1 Tax=Paenibacillus hexagrammi TaxID=2908839 RepID=A0ABY3SFL1_9BACL|nr:SLC13 family permease [Paenibacillus sp. YPD9-1]UJF31971.1 anion permease [Paenibacillus sp. YPD9-1]
MNDYSQGPVGWQAIAAVLIYGAAYIGIITERWNRSYIALGGAILMLIIGAVPFHLAMASFARWDTLIWMTSLFIIAIGFQRTGMMSYLAAALIRKNRIKPLTILFGVSMLTAIGSAFVDSVVMILIIVPIMLNTAKLLKLSPVPFMLSIVLSANLGGASTAIGSVTNRFVGEAAGFTFWQMLRTLGPLMALLLVIVYAALWMIYGRSLVVPEANRREVLAIQPAELLGDRLQVIGGSLILLLFLIAEMLQGVLGWRGAYIALAGAAAFILLNYSWILTTVRTRDYRLALQGILESQFLYFFGLFVMTGGLVYAGVTGLLAVKSMELSQGSIPFLSIILVGITGVGSAMIDHVPFAVAMVPTIHDIAELAKISEMGPATSLWWSLMIGGAVGGGATLLGSTAGMLAGGLAMQGQSGFSQRDYLKFALPVSVVLFIVAACYIRIVIT